MHAPKKENRQETSEPKAHENLFPFVQTLEGYHGISQNQGHSPCKRDAGA